jgi:hypothetical protein
MLNADYILLLCNRIKYAIQALVWTPNIPNLIEICWAVLEIKWAGGQTYSIDILTLHEYNYKSGKLKPYVVL